MLIESHNAGSFRVAAAVAGVWLALEAEAASPSDAWQAHIPWVATENSLRVEHLHEDLDLECLVRLNKSVLKLVG